MSRRFETPESAPAAATPGNNPVTLPPRKRERETVPDRRLESELLLSWPLWSAVATALFLAGLTQGALPTISTLLFMLPTDVNTAIILPIALLLFAQGARFFLR